MQFILASLLILSTMLACRDMKTRPETADKLKPILVLVNPPTESKTPTQPLPKAVANPPLPGQTVTLEFHFIGPAGITGVTLSEGELEARPLTVPITGWSIDSPELHDYPGLRHITIAARVAVPSAASLTQLWPAFASEGLVRLRYTMVVSDGTRNLPIAGDFVVYRDKTVESSQWTLYGSSIDSPAAGEAPTDPKLTIASTLQNSQNEPIKIAWFVSDGEIKNRRASSTEWKLPGAGSYTLVFTIRGKDSRNGDIQIRQVTLP